MPAILLGDDALHVQPLHPATDRVARLYRDLGFGFHPDARAATSRLDAEAGGRILGLSDPDSERSLLGVLEPGWHEQRIGAKPADHEDLLGLTRYRFPLNDLRKVAAGERFPELSIEVRGPSYFRETYDLTPDLPGFFAGSTSPEALAYGRAVADLFDAAMREGWRGEWVAGWLERPAVEWEKVDAFPEDVPRPPGYRTMPQQGKRIVAERDGGGVFDRLVRAFLPGARRSPRRVVLTDDTIYADFGGEVFTLPRGLSRRVDGRAMVFGRFAGLHLETRAEPCPVVTALGGFPDE